MKSVLDTHVLVAALVAEGLCRSEALLKELSATLRRKFKVTAADIPWLEEYRAKATLRKPLPLRAPVCRDPDDDLVLATALAAQAAIIVTGDEDLLIRKQHAGILILSPRRFLEHLDGLA